MKVVLVFQKMGHIMLTNYLAVPPEVRCQGWIEKCPDGDFCVLLKDTLVGQLLTVHSASVNTYSLTTTTSKSEIVSLMLVQVTSLVC